MKNLLILFVLFNTVFSPFACAQTKVVRTVKDVAMPQYYQNDVYGNDLAAVEDYLYGKIYYNENLPSRLCRIEKSLFNRYFTTMTNAQRMNNILANYRNDYNNYSANRYSQNSSPAQRILNRFIGQPTGFTPPVMNLPFNDYGRPYGINRGFYNNRGSYVYNNEMPASGGFGVHILD